MARCFSCFHTLYVLLELVLENKISSSNGAAINWITKPDHNARVNNRLFLLVRLIRGYFNDFHFYREIRKIKYPPSPLAMVTIEVKSKREAFWDWSGRQARIDETQSTDCDIIYHTLN